MSKLQKALGKLRESNREVVAEPKGVAAPATDAIALDDQPTPQQQGRRPVRVRTRPPEPPSPVKEFVPDLKMSIDRESLQRQGLLPREEHERMIAQQFRRIKRPILNTAFGLGVPESDNANVIMVASALPKSGKTFCSVNLAASIARERDTGTVLIDADVLKPNISNALGLAHHKGLIDYLLDRNIRMEDVLVGTDLYDVIVMPAGSHHDEATELLASRRMEEFISLLSQRFANRAVVFDTPPLLVTSEANVLAEHMGQIVMVIEAGVSTQDSVVQALKSLNRSKPVNAILNKARDLGFGEYHGSSYQYYSDSPRASKDGT